MIVSINWMKRYEDGGIVSGLGLGLPGGGKGG